MKITDWAILFVAVFVPFFLLLSLNSKQLSDTSFIEMKYTWGIRTAVQDGGTALNTNEDPAKEAGYGSSKRFRADKDKALHAFSETLYINMGIEDDELAQQALWWYIPALAVIDYDGYYIYAMQSYNSSGKELWRHMWTPKIPFAYNDSSGNSIHFTLDDYVEIFEPSAAEWSSGVRSEISSLSDVPLLREKEKFEAVRRTVIVHSVQEDLAYYIQRHNNIAAGNGISYTFTFPLIDQEDWSNSINDIGMMAFIQGIPLGDKTYNHYALGGGRLLKAPVYYGSVDSDGMRYYFREDCRAPGERREVFSSAKEAAAAGYIERTCIGAREP